MSRPCLILAVVTVSVICAVSAFGCPVKKQLISSDLIGPLPFAALPGQQCDDCPIPDLMVMDFDAGTLPPSDHGITDEQIDFEELYFAAGGFFNEAFNNDPRHECMRYFDNHFQPNAKTVREMLPSQPIPPPTGAITGVDYVVGGKITGSRGHYSMSVSLEDATTREQVASSSVQFANAGDALEAGNQAERAMAPLFDKIRSYQKKLRDRSDDMAIHAKLKVTPSREKMNVGEQQPVEIFAYDCDGEDHPLKNRKIKLSSNNGTFSPSEVTTGADGKIKSNFTASKKGLANLNATYYPYTTVTHKQSGAHEDVTVQIGDPPSGVWQVEITATENTFDDTVVDKTDGEGRSQKDDHQSIKRTAHVVFWIKGVEDGGQINGTEIVSVAGSGTFDFLSSVFHLDTGPSCTHRVKDVNTADGRFDPNPESTVFSFTVYPDRAEVSGTVNLKGSGVDDQWFYEACATPPGGHSHNDQADVGYPIELGYGSDTLSVPQTAETRKTRVYKFSLTKDENEPHPETGNVYRRQRSGTIILKALTISQTPAGLRRH